jgi:aromatic-L-amino-acid decarboxylase
MNPDIGPVDEYDLGDMPIEEFRNTGYELIDWICSYFEDIENYPVLSKSAPGSIKKLLPFMAPESGEDVDRIMDDFDKKIMPGITHWNHPGFFAYFSTTSSAPAILGEMLSNTLNVNCMLWKTSPAATELEEKTAEWLRTMLHLPKDFFGMIVDTDSRPEKTPGRYGFTVLTRHIRL